MVKHLAALVLGEDALQNYAREFMEPDQQIFCNMDLFMSQLADQTSDDVLILDEKDRLDQIAYWTFTHDVQHG